VSPAIVWFRHDLRLRDNPALKAALERGGPVVPVCVLDDVGERPWAGGAASKWWLHGSLEALDTSLRERGSRLVVRRGDSLVELMALISETGARAVYWNHRCEPSVVARDGRIQGELARAGIEAKNSNGAYLFEPNRIANREGRPFRMFTPFWRHCLELPIDRPVKSDARHIPAPRRWPASLDADQRGLLPRISWDGGLKETWVPGEKGAGRRLKRFVTNALEAYDRRRDLPAEDGSSQLSASLHFGELGPRQVWAAVAAVGRDMGVCPASEGARVFLSELGWREFAQHLLFHFPFTPQAPLRSEFAGFDWAKDPGDAQFTAWTLGLTGYPIVDAGMRQLWRLGWMHNRVRMIVASFLVKHLRLPWQKGAAWFWDTLVDAGLANNTLGWQWSAGCGADAAPYFRIFAPVVQGERFDPEGAYVRRWVPELNRVPATFIHHPWDAPPNVLASAGVRLGEDYPRPVVDHAAARVAALAAFKKLRMEANHP